nr:TolC family protein [Saprospiraceae bacterium]
MNRNYIVLTALILVLASKIVAQETWTLEKCINYAQQNNITVKQTDLSVADAQLLEKQSKLARYPSLNGSTNFGYNFGRSIDPTTNAFAAQNIGFNSYNISGNMILYNGSRISNAIVQSQYNREAASANAEQTRNNISLQVASTYLQILLAEDQLENANKKLQLTQNQLNQLDKLVQVGMRPANDKLDIEAQLATDEQQIVGMQNNVAIAYLTLKQLLQLDPNHNMKVEHPKVDTPQNINLDAYTLTDVFNKALNTQPQIRAADWQLKSAEVAIDIAKSGLLPTLSLFGDISSRFSTLSKSIAGFTTQQISQEIQINGQPVTITTEQDIPILERTSYFDQLDQNRSQSLGLALNVPIYNNGSSKISMQRAKLNVETQQLQNTQIRQSLKSEIQKSITDAKAAQKSLVVAEKTQMSRKAALE